MKNKKLIYTSIFCLLLIIIAIIFYISYDNNQEVDQNELDKELSTYQSQLDNKNSYTYTDSSEYNDIEVHYDSSTNTYEYHGEYVNADEEDQVIDFDYNIDKDKLTINTYKLDGKDIENTKQLEDNIPEASEFDKNIETTLTICTSLFDGEDVSKSHDVYSVSGELAMTTNTCELNIDTKMLTRTTTLPDESNSTVTIKFDN